MNINISRLIALLLLVCTPLVVVYFH